ncbi:MAG TPA: M42 family metallopeptidase [Anaerolineales bacterium]|nr:M42 family metallopeptidase [Anaerolineales bacterium]
MAALPSIDRDYLLKFLVDLLNIPSPTGRTDEAIAFVEKELAACRQLKLSRTRKGALVATWEGRQNDSPRALTAHVDTLGAMVKQIKSNGRLKITRLGGLLLNAVETEGCWVLTPTGGRMRGSLLIDAASSHVYGAKAGDTERDEDHMEIRLDAVTSSEQETRELGIRIGDFVVFDPRVEVTNGFVRSRFLDDKACVAAIVAAIKSLSESGQRPAQSVTFLFSNYEEVGHGAAAGIPPAVHELVTVDMAAVGEGQESDEFHATLCLKDSGGPYHHGLSNKLRLIADQNRIPFKTDIYPYYGSDGEAYWRAGGDVAVALIGPGVDASHNYERTHTEALLATSNWIMAYLLNE